MFVLTKKEAQLVSYALYDAVLWEESRIDANGYET